jgi:thiamine biosynthesis lipoprotein
MEKLLRLEKSFDAMGSTSVIVLYGGDRDQMEAAINDVFDEIRRLDEMLSNYRPSSQLSELNRSAAERAVMVSPELFQLLKTCLEFSRLSEGAFDISVGALQQAWDFFKGTGRLPSPAEVAAALTRVGYRHIGLDEANRTVRFDCPGIMLDPGGIGKGYAVDRVVETLKQRGIGCALVAASASSIYGMGAPPLEPKGWKVKVLDPRDSRKSLTEVFLKNMAISTSGNYEKSFWDGERFYSHILDPRTGYPARGTSLVAVVAPRALESEAWTKPYFINGRCWTAEHKPEAFRVFYCVEEPVHACAWM